MDRFKTVLASIFLALLIMTSGVVIALNFRPLYYYMSEKLSIPASAGFSEEEARADYDALISYNSIFGSKTLEFNDIPQSEGGRIHFYEVKRIFVIIEITMYISLVATILLSIERIKSKKYSYLKYGSLTAVLLPVAVGVPAALFWEKTFITFHKIAFSNDYWMMDPRTDPIVLILPEEYFAACTALIAGLIILFSVAAFITYKILKKREKV